MPSGIVVQNGKLLSVKWIEFDLRIIDSVLKGHGIAQGVLLDIIVEPIIEIALQHDLQGVLIDVQRCILALLLDIEVVAAALSGNHRDRELVAARPQDLLDILPGIHIQLDRAEFSEGLPVEIWIQGLRLNSNFAAKVLC